jgi:SAM-dependent methyltransferase
VKIRQALELVRFRGSAKYWERRYKRGGTSGSGSYGDHATYKARFLNEFVAAHDIRTVVEFGCGDGNQLALAEYPAYLGIDVSETAVRACIDRFSGDPSKSFAAMSVLDDPAGFIRAELALSLDVLYHLVEDDVFDRYMRSLFGAATRFVVIYATDDDRSTFVPHVRHRRFTGWVAANTGWALAEKMGRPEAAFEDFFTFMHP